MIMTASDITRTIINTQHYNIHGTSIQFRISHLFVTPVHIDCPSYLLRPSAYHTCSTRLSTTPVWQVDSLHLAGANGQHMCPSLLATNHSHLPSVAVHYTCLSHMSTIPHHHHHNHASHLPKKHTCPPHLHNIPVYHTRPPPVYHTPDYHS